MDQIETVLKAGDIAKAVTAIIGLLAIILIKPARTAYAKHKAEREEQKAFRTMMKDRLDSIETKIGALIDDMGDMQYERLAQAHDFYTGQGWCPSTTKQQLCQMHKSYKQKGRNHLSDAYEDEILKLKEHP